MRLCMWSMQAHMQKSQCKARVTCIATAEPHDSQVPSVKHQAGRCKTGSEAKLEGQAVYQVNELSKIATLTEIHLQVEMALLLPCSILAHNVVMSRQRCDCHDLMHAPAQPKMQRASQHQPKTGLGQAPWQKRNLHTQHDRQVGMTGQGVSRTARWAKAHSLREPSNLYQRSMRVLGGKATSQWLTLLQWLSVNSAAAVM